MAGHSSAVEYAVVVTLVALVAIAVVLLLGYWTRPTPPHRRARR